MDKTRTEFVCSQCGEEIAPQEPVHITDGNIYCVDCYRKVLNERFPKQSRLVVNTAANCGNCAAHSKRGCGLKPPEQVYSLEGNFVGTFFPYTDEAWVCVEHRNAHGVRDYFVEETSNE